MTVAPNPVQPAAGHTIRPARELHWNHALGFLALIAAATLLTTVIFHAHSFGAFLYAWLLSAYSFYPFILAAFLLTWTKPRGVVGFLLHGVLFVAMVWYIASSMIYAEQLRHMLWPELQLRLSDAQLRQDVWFMLLTWRLPAVALAFAGAAFGLQRVCGKLNKSACRAAFIFSVAGILCAGTLLVSLQDSTLLKLAQRYLTAASAPWSYVHNDYRDFKGNFSLSAATAVRAQVAPPFFKETPDPVLAPLAGKYVGRSVILVVMESQRASDIAGLGENAFGHVPCAPEFTRHAAHGLLFENYFASGTSTYSALWSLFTGLPLPVVHPSPVVKAPEAAQVGRISAFKSLNYLCQGMCPANPKFDNWGELLKHAEMRYWFEAGETSGLSREFWTNFGMPDDQLYALAFKRYAASVQQRQPTLLCLLTVSNHHPFIFPRGKNGEFSADHHGGMRFADYCLGEFLSALRKLPALERPIVFVTSDTAHPEGLSQAPPLYERNLENLRVPGLLLLPDEHLAGTRYSGVFGHEDVFDLLYLLIKPADSGADVKKFAQAQRQVLANGGIFLTKDSYRAGQHGTFAIRERWKLDESTGAEKETLDAAEQRYRADVESMWRK